MQFQTDFRFHDRQTKAEYVYHKYGPILADSVLDVGADEGYLRQYLDRATHYWGVGLGGNPDQELNLESGCLPFQDGSYQTVLCLDVLEHLDRPHPIFDEICRVSRRWVLISLPNPWRAFWSVLRGGAFRLDQPIKYYGLPPDPPPDRHRWFFSAAEARTFVTMRAQRNRMRIVQMDHDDGSPRRPLKERVRTGALRLLLGRRVDVESLLAGPLWALLEHEDGR